MKICILTHTFPKYPNDSTAAFMHPLVTGLIQVGNEIIVLAPFHKDFNTSKFPYKIVTYKYIWPDSLHVLGYSQTLKKGTSFKFETYLLAPLLYFFGFIALLKLLLKEKIDIISTHWILPNGFIAYLATRIIDIPYVVSLPGSDVYIANKNALFSYMARLATKGARALSADSPKYVEELKKTGAAIGESSIISYPVDISFLKTTQIGVNKIKKKLGINADTITLLGVGRLVEKKGFYYLLKAMALVSKKNKNALLVIAGKGDIETDLKKLAKDLGIENVVTFVGNIQRKEIVLYYNLADIFIMPSIEDNQGNIDDRPVALLEAMACGKAVVATNFPGNALTVQDGFNGFLVVQKDPQAISEIILRLCESKKLRIDMGEKARISVKAQFNHKVIAEKYSELFKKVLGQK